ncbi:hypothetical protein QR680_003884 [Steinernema hermaphroditum]|uniref:Uncharacterized protein n=1 Tax=Steinernema hermaphroditum TaxID=289476 RepID=A0AA39HP70_9BILA|nr:hypothetical protein QR680_003884 [Steinernema hermaphroditum]
MRYRIHSRGDFLNLRAERMNAERSESIAAQTRLSVARFARAAIPYRHSDCIRSTVLLSEHSPLFPMEDWELKSTEPYVFQAITVLTATFASFLHFYGGPMINIPQVDCTPVNESDLPNDTQWLTSKDSMESAVPCISLLFTSALIIAICGPVYYNLWNWVSFDKRLRRNVLTVFFICSSILLIPCVGSAVKSKEAPFMWGYYFLKALFTDVDPELVPDMFPTASFVDIDGSYKLCVSNANWFFNSMHLAVYYGIVVSIFYCIYRYVQPTPKTPGMMDLLLADDAVGDIQVEVESVIVFV